MFQINKDNQKYNKNIQEITCDQSQVIYEYNKYIGGKRNIYITSQRKPPFIYIVLCTGVGNVFHVTIYITSYTPVHNKYATYCTQASCISSDHHLQTSFNQHLQYITSYCLASTASHLHKLAEEHLHVHCIHVWQCQVRMVPLGQNWLQPSPSVMLQRALVSSVNQLMVIFPGMVCLSMDLLHVIYCTVKHVNY